MKAQSFEKPVRVLQVLHNLKKGGVQADTIYPVRILPRSSLTCDVLLLSNTEGELESEFCQYGRIFRIPVERGKHKISRLARVWHNPFVVYRQTLRFLRENRPYDAVHVRHMMFIAPCLMAAKRAGVPVRIGHSHVNAPEGERLYVRLYLKLCGKIIARCATLKVGVTKDACRYLFGNDNTSRVIKTPTVDLAKFSPAKYPKCKHEGLSLIQVGSFGSRKNQAFTLEVLSALRKRDTDARLTLIGYSQPGSDIMTILESKIAALGLAEHVSFLPSDANVAEAMAASDVMILPSLQEGLPNTALEAQAMGLPCFLATAVSDDCDMGLCEFLPLERGADFWAEQITEYVSRHGLAKCPVDMSSYDNVRVCEQYLALWKGACWEESEKMLNM